jgi:hypothetical protein
VAPRPPELAPLDVLVGAWTQQVQVPGVPAGRMELEWTLDGRFLMQQTEIPDPVYPNSFAVISGSSDWHDDASSPFVYHYFDSRGVVRVYEMRVQDRVWTLERTKPDFTPLAFAQRFEGVLSSDGGTIDGRWEASHDGGASWELDFPLRYTRLG